MLILICDDEPMVRLGLKAMLEELAPSVHEYIESINGRELVAKAKLRPDLAFVDVQMPVMNGLDAIEAARDLTPATKWVLLTGHAQFDYARRALRLGISEYLLKPVGIYEISALMSRADEWKDSGKIVQSYLKAVTDLDFDVSSPQRMALQIQELSGAKGELLADTISKAKAYVQRHYKDDIGVNSIADYLEITPNYLSRIFRNQTGVKLSDYLNGVRIIKAKELLSGNPNAAIKDVAEQVGYYSSRHFTKVFYKIAGMTPSEYQRIYRFS